MRYIQDANIHAKRYLAPALPPYLERMIPNQDDTTDSLSAQSSHSVLLQKRTLPEKEILRVRLKIIGDLSTMLHAWVILTYNFDELITDYRPSNAS